MSKRENPIDPNDRAAIQRVISENPAWAGLLDDVRREIPRRLAEVDPRPDDAETLMGLHLGAVDMAGMLVNVKLRGGGAACAPGCAWCCKKAVQVTGLEALTLAAAVAERYTEEQQQKLLARLRAYQRQWDAAAPERRLQIRADCPLLAGDRCSVYDARPLICAGYNSSDARACARGYASGWAPGTWTPIRLEYMVTVQLVADTFRRELADRGVPDRFYVLAPALLLALTTENATERWLAGEDVLAPAAWPNENDKRSQP